jgi:hypothetical protein
MRLKDKTVYFEDRSKYEFNDFWIEAIKLQYNKSLEDYFKEIRPEIRKMREDGVYLTKFGKEDAPFGMTMSEHFKKCVYADLRACLMGMAFKLIGSDCKVVALQKDGSTKEY